MAHETDAAAALRGEWAEALASQGLAGPDVETIVQRLVSYLQRNHGGTELYIPVLGREYPVEEIRQAVERGDSIRSICKRHQVDRRTLYRLIDDASTW